MFLIIPLPPQSAAAVHYDKTVYHLPPEFDKDRVWLEPINEVDKNRADWLGFFARSFAEIANADGYKVTLFGWSSGEPEPEHWELPGMLSYLQLCGERPNRAAVSLHEYSYNVNDIQNGYPDLIGRFTYLFAACDLRGLPRPTVHITEWGWELDKVPPPDLALPDCDWAHSIYDPYPQIKGAGIWYLGPGFGGIADQAQKLIAPVTNRALELGPGPPDPPDPPPGGEWVTVYDQWFDTMNESGDDWYDQNGVQQVPTGWVLENAEGRNTIGNPEGNDWGDWNLYEALYRWGAFLPPEEHDWFLNERGFCYKMFARQKAWAGRMLTPSTLGPGLYRIEIEYVDDCYVAIVNGNKVPPPDPLSFEVALGVGGLVDFNEDASYWQPSEFLQKQMIGIATIVEGEGNAAWFAARSRWAILNPAAFVQRFRVQKYVGEPDPPDPPEPGRGSPRVQYKRTVVLFPPGYGGEWAAAAADATWNKYDYTLGKSADDAGIGDLDYRRVLAVNPGEWGTSGELAGFFQEYYPGIKFDPIIAETPQVLKTILENYDDPPPTSFRLGKPMEGAAVKTSSFNDPRDYNGDGVPEQRHEGVDFAPTPISTPTVYALATNDGMVIRVENRTTGYGTFVVIEHNEGGETYRTWYCHLGTALVSPNHLVVQGQQIGVVGSTGNSKGRHLHFNLQWLGHGSTDWVYVVPDVVDPVPFFDWNWENPDPPPPTGQALFGLHATADVRTLNDGERAAEASLFAESKTEIIKVLSATDPALVAQLATENTGASWVVRAFLTFGGRDVTPEQFIDWTLSDVQRTIGAIGPRPLVVELHNEPNLYVEGLGTSWADGAEFATWVTAVAQLYWMALPGIILMYPGLSPGPTVPGLRVDHVEFIEGSRAAVNMLGELGVHIYWNADAPMAAGLATLDDYINRFPGKRIWVTESSNNRPADDITKADQYVEFWRELRKRSTVQGVTYYVSSASDPAFADEVWLGTTIGSIVGQR